MAVERAMYNAIDSKRDGHSSKGLEKASTSWYFAEGCPAGTFEQYLLIFNPNLTEAKTQVSFYRDDAKKYDFGFQIPPFRKVTIHVDELEGLQQASNSCEIHSDAPVVSEQSLYFALNR